MKLRTAIRNNNLFIHKNLNMADTKIFNLIPASLQEDLIEEVKQILKEREQGTDNKKIDPDVLAFIKDKKNKTKK